MSKKGQYQDLTGKKFSRLTVIEFVEIRNGTPYWRCRCDCGNERIVQSYHLKNGHTKSCGCFKQEQVGNLNRKTGASNSRLYMVYRNMLNRCFWDKSNMKQSYGGRGITICDEWLGEHGFERFYEWATCNGYKDIRNSKGRSVLTLDRINVNGNYEPSNCRWVDVFVQANNKRNNHYIKINGETDTVANMARKYQISYWNLLHYSKGGKNCKYPDLQIEVTDEICK